MTTKPRYIWVKNWDRFQSERTPNWIRLWAKGLLHDDGWLGLTDAQRGLLVGIWMLASQSGNGRINAEIGLLNMQLGTTGVREKSLDALIQAGFITLRSKKAQSQLGVHSALEESRGSSTKNHRGEETRASARPTGTNEKGEPLNGRYGLTAAGIRAEAARMIREGELPA